MRIFVSLAAIVAFSLGVLYAEETTIQGCLSGPNDEGVYELKTKDETIEVGGLEGLKDHVGHEVKLTGEFVESGEESGEKEEEEEEESEGKGRHFKVSKMEHISATCK